MKLAKEFRFEASHSLPQLPDGHKCKRPHGHSYLFRVWCEGELDPSTGFVGSVDYAQISLFARARVVDVLDHRDINEFIKPYSTAEYLAKWIFDQLKPVLPVCAVDVHETATTIVRYEG